MTVSASSRVVEIDGARASVTLDRFDLDAYALFLRVKALPEKLASYDHETDRYVLSFPARFAAEIEAGHPVTAGTDVALAPHLFDYQTFIVQQALAARRYAIWADTGLGKTAMQLEWARHVRDRTDGPVLLLAPTHELIAQTVQEAWDFYGADLHIETLRTREQLASWCDRPRAAVAIATYHLLIPGELPQLRNLAGLVADESSILKTGGGTIKWNLIKSARGIEHKLSCTATPAPNDTMEYASQAAFLEKLRDEGEILWTYFTKDKRGNWRVKGHAREAFYKFMAGWSIYLRDPAAYGFADILSTLPPPVIAEHKIALTEPQRAAMHELLAHAGRGLFDERLGVRERAKLSQIAKGFMYQGASSDRTVRYVESVKPRLVADLVASEVAAGRPTIVWTVFDEESRILERELADLAPAALHGDQAPEDRLQALQDFKLGDTDILISKASLIGYGLNLQHAKAMVFSGFDDSFERLYQAIRRAYRFGQTDQVHVHVPVVPELEGLMLANLKRKQELFDSDVAIQEQNYRAVLAHLLPRAAV